MHRSVWGKISVLLASLLPGTLTGESLCGRWTRLFGSDCLACRIVGLIARNPQHCISHFIWEAKERRK
jgi:hypothetical protein